MKRFTRYGHYTGEVEDNRINQTRNCFLSHFAKKLKGLATV